jgi:hypothetical protein
MNHSLQVTRSPVNLLGAFVFVMAGICLPRTAYAGQLNPTSNPSARSSSSQAAKEPPSCTPEMSAQGNTQPSAHSVILSWKASTSPGVVGYNVYRRDKTSAKFSKINQKPIATTNCIDYFVQLRHRYDYYVVAADHTEHFGVREGGHSNIAQAKIPRK